MKDQKINFINNLLCCALFPEPPTALSCTYQIGEVFREYDKRIAVIIRRRIEALSCHKNEIGKHKLESLRQRLFTYRKQLTWPADAETQRQFKHLLRLLYHFAMENLNYYIPIRSELASCILHRNDPILAHIAKKIELNENSKIPAFQHIGLSDLQSTLTCDEDMKVFSRMVFSRMQSYQKIDLLKIGEDKNKYIVVTK